MTEAKIMKALDYCIKQGLTSECTECPYKGTKRDCMGVMLEDALDLLNRKNAENEELSIEIHELIVAKDQLFDEAEVLIKKARGEAIKEFSGEIQTEIEKAMRISFTAMQGRREKLIDAGATEKDLVNDDIICWLEGHISAFKSMGYFVELLANKKGVEL